MKKKYLPFLTLMVSGMLFLVSCSEDNAPAGGDSDVPQAVLDDFQSRYGDTRAVWSVSDGYAMAEFRDGNSESAVWYALDGLRLDMTKTEIPFEQLPQPIVEAIAESAYAGWTPDPTVDVLERNNAEKLYVVEMRNGGVEVELYYTGSGVLVAEYVDSDDKDNDYSGYLPQQPTGSIDGWIEQNFPGASIVDVDVERNRTEVEIIHNGMKHEILFDASFAWMQTKTEYGRRNVPDVVSAFVSANYPGYRIDDVDLYENSAGKYYCVEIEKGDFEKKIYLNLQGEEIERPASGGTQQGGGSSQATGGIATFIEKQYPGAVITEFDYDDGKIEVEIIHEKREKEMLFNFKEEWLRTTYDIFPNELPEAVKSAIAARFGDNALRGDDSSCIETPDGTFYEVEVRGDIEVYVNEAGKILSTDR